MSIERIKKGNINKKTFNLQKNTCKVIMCSYNNFKT